MKVLMLYQMLFWALLTVIMKHFAAPEVLTDMMAVEADSNEADGRTEGDRMVVACAGLSV